MIQSLKPVTINFKDKFFHNSIHWSGLYPQVYVLPCLGNVLVYRIQYSETLPSHDLSLS